MRLFSAFVLSLAIQVAISLGATPALPGYINLNKPDPNSIYAQAMNISNAPDKFTVNGNTYTCVSNGVTGFITTGIKDFNNDGFGDFAVLSSRNCGIDKKGFSVGVAHIIFGNPGLRGLNIDLSLFDTPALLPPQIKGFRIIAPASYTQNVGLTLSPAGDFNNDGYGDLIIAPLNMDKVFILYGKSKGAVYKDVDLSAFVEGVDGITVTGPYFSGIQEFTVSPAGDFNKDGIDDVVIGGLYASFGSNFNSGCVFVIFGRATSNGTPIVADLALSPSDGFILYGGYASEMLGWAVRPAGDVNGDGYSDVVISTLPKNFWGQGRVVILYGREVNSATGNVMNIKNFDNSQPGAFIFDCLKFNALNCDGASTGIGDFNKDGIDDVIISSPNKVYVLFGNKNGLADKIKNFESVARGLWGFVVYVDFDPAFTRSSMVNALGDLNNDGYMDFLISDRVPSYGMPFPKDGRRYFFVIYGSGPTNNNKLKFNNVYISKNNISGTSRRMTVIEENHGPINPLSNPGTHSGLLDINAYKKDKFNDLVIGIPRYNGDRGMAYVVFGGKRRTN